MPTKWNKFKRKRRDASKRARGIVDNKLLKKRMIDLTAKEKEFNELPVHTFENYYEINYPGSKLDLIAIPDFAMGAMGLSG